MPTALLSQLGPAWLAQEAEGEGSRGISSEALVGLTRPEATNWQALDPTDTFGAHQLAIAPNNFVGGLCVCKTQIKFAWRFKIRPGSESHAAGRSIFDEAIARCSTRPGQDRRYLPYRVARRATLLVASGQDQVSPNALARRLGCAFAESHLAAWKLRTT